ncbi:DUF342 domain-containing protein [Oceanispirochaeta sp.]|jgi:uncharacterized protein (DUF342 family)|uniref:DUF342 domain-containing protein n=1 Tax=Oceanispirochaeta sp. TaxID=2035350 RepID=UPI00261CB8F8|nr:FapA family protein [Oceanispirochaeta sp.]MDA3955429.1 FapA family protein [Oceanispirochaeta sp.]
MSSQNNSDKRFSLYYRNGYAVLRVYPPTSQENRVFAEEVMNRMKILGIPMVRMMQLDEIIERADGSIEKIVEWPAGAHLSPSMQLRVREDRMKAEILIEPPKIGGGKVTEEQLHYFLEDHKILHGVLQPAIIECIERGIYNEWIEIALGTAPVHGQGGKVKYHFSKAPGKPFRELPFGRIDLRELNFIQYKEAGDLLAELEEPIAPHDGTDVTGEIISASPAGEGETLNAGDLTEIREDKIYALESGNVRIDKNAVILEPVVTVNDVDYNTGNLVFQGSVIVKGHVADGFSIIASGDIQIGKSVGRVHLETGRNLLLQSGINGDKEGHLDVKGDLYARFIESSFVHAKGSVFVSGALLNSTVKIGGDLMMEGGRCEIVGGLTVAKGWVKCRKIGSLYEAKTNVVVGVEPEELDVFFKILKDIQSLREDQDHMDKQVRHFSKICKTREATELNFRQKDQAEAQVLAISKKIHEKSKDLQIMRKELVPSEESFVLAEDMIYVGTKVSFGLLDFTPEQRGASKTILQTKDGSIRETGYNPAQIPEDIKKALPGNP